MISTSPPGGAKAAKGSTVTMIVSSGPSPTTTQATTTTVGGTTSVPSVFNLDQTQAQTVLANSGFTSSCTATGTPGNGRVVSQNPTAGSQAPTGSTVTFKISATACT